MIPELAVVETLVPLVATSMGDDNAQIEIPVGTRGTIVLVYGQEAYEIEFNLGPEPALAAVPAANVREVGRLPND